MVNLPMRLGRFSCPEEAHAVLEMISGEDDLGVAMYAVVQRRTNEPFDFRVLDISKSQQTHEFDTRLATYALAEYESEDSTYVSLTDALDLRGAIALLSVADYSTLPSRPAVDTAEKSRQLLPLFLAALPELEHRYDLGELDLLEKGDFTQVRGLLFVYQFGSGGCLYAYQKTQPASVLERSSFLYRVKNGHSFQLFTEQSIKIARRFDFVVFGDDIAASRPTTLVNQFGLLEIRKDQALEKVAAISSYVENVEGIVRRVKDGRKRSITKILRIAESPVIGMGAHELRTRLEASEEYKGKFKFSEDDKIIALTAAEIQDVLKMLNDELVKSPISNAVYESEIKELVR